jgi:hypothetical protein
MGEMIKKEIAEKVLHVEIGFGLTIEQMLDASNVAPTIREFVVVHLNGEELPTSEWSTYRLAPEDKVDLYLRPAGDSGKEILRLIATIAIIVIAFKLGAILGPKLATAGIVGSAETGVAIVTASISAVGTTLLNAFIPPPSVNLPSGGYETGESYFLTAQSNSARPYSAVPVVYGRMKMIGALAAQPEVFSAGDSTLFTTLIDWGLGQSNVFNYRAGDTKLTYFQASIVEHTNVPAWIDDSDPSQGLSYVPLELLQYPLNSVELSIGLSSNADTGTANTVPTAYSAVVELLFPQGITYFDDQGNTQNLGVTFKGEYKKAGGPEWLPWPEGTQGFAGDSHIRFGQGSVGPDPNPSEEPSVSFAVPESRVSSGADFVSTITFDREVYAVDFTDFTIVNSSTGEDVTDDFVLVSETEITQSRVWQYVFTAPSVADDTSTQYVILTNIQNFIDSPPPYGQPFPNKAYESSAFIVQGANTGTGPDPDPDPDPIDPTLYDRTEGNETFVRLTGIYNRFSAGVDYVAGDPTTWDVQGFEIWVGGEKQTVYYGSFDLYAGVFQEFSSSPAFGGSNVVVEYWSLKRADGGGVNRNNRFITIPDNWTPVGFSNNFTIYGNKPQPAKASIVILFPERGEYEIKVTRIGDNSSAENESKYVSTCYWSRLASRGYPYYPDTLDGRQSILNLKRRHTMTEIRLEASERVQGNLSEISATVVSQLRRHNGTQWTAPANSANPAWIVADILLGYRAQQVRVPTNLQDHGGYLDESQVNIDSIREFARVCNEVVTYTQNGVELERRRYEMNFVLASDAPIIETVQNILSMCRSRLILGQDGKLAVMMDSDRGDQVRQVFTPANSWGFGGDRIFQTLPHGLRVSFISPELGYQKATVEVFRPPYTKATATTFEDLETFGCTNWHMAAQYGMYVFGQMILRTETFKLNVAAESLVVQIGDVVEIANDAAALGGGSHLIVEQTAPSVVVLSEEPNAYSDPYYTLKTGDGVIQGRVLSVTGRTIQLDKEVDPVITANGVGVIVIGQKDLVTKKYIIQEIAPSQDFSAALTLIPYDSRVYETDNGQFPEWSAGGDGDPQNPENGGNARTVDLEGFTYLEYENRQPISVSDLSWDLLTADAALSGWKIQWTQEGQDTQIDLDLITSDKRGYQHKYNAINGEFGAGTYVVTPVSQLGYDGRGMSVFVGKSVDRTPPPDPTRFRVVAYPNYCIFYWARPDCPDLAGYTLTKTDSQTGAFESTLVEWDEEQFTWWVPLGRYGSTFTIMATDTSGNNSNLVKFNGLANGIPNPPLVVPFFYEPARELENGTTFPVSINWEDVLSEFGQEPSRLISHYQIRWDPDVYGDSLSTTTLVHETNHPSREMWVPSANRYGEEGCWYISAVDHFNQRGPWNRCSSIDLDYYMVMGLIQRIDHYPLGHPLERQPFSEIDIQWDVAGSDADKVELYRLWLFPKQPEFDGYQSTVYPQDTDRGVYYLPNGEEVKPSAGQERYLGAILYYEGTEKEVTIYMDQLPNYQKYHQGTFIVEGLVPRPDSSLYDKLGQAARENWDMFYDRQGPVAPPSFSYVRNPNDFTQIALRWMPCPDPDIEHYEIRYASRVDSEWDTSMIIGQPDFYHNSYDGVSAEGYAWFDEFRAGQYMIRGVDTTGNVGQMSTLVVDAGGIDPNEGWSLIQSIEGHDDFVGTLDNLYRKDGSITIFLDEDTPVIDGVQTAYFTYDETTEIEVLAETRVVSETLQPFDEDRPYFEYISDWTLLSDVQNMAEGYLGTSNVTLTHEIKLPNSDVWQEFGDSEFLISGTTEYRIKLVNDELGGNAGIRRSRILVYIKSEEVELKWPETTKTEVIRLTR